MQNYLQSLGNGASTFMSNYLGSLNKTPVSTQPAVSTKPQQVTTSNVGATAITPPPVPKASTTSAKSAYVNSLTSNPVSTTQPTQTNLTVTQNQPITGNVTTPSGAVVNATTGTTVSAPQPPANAAYADAYQKYIQSLQPSQDVTSATKNLNDLTLQSQKDQTNALYRNGGTTTSAGEEANKINRDESFAIDAASNNLNALSSQQTANTNAAKARADFENGLLQDKASADKTAFDENQTTKNTAQVQANADRTFAENQREFGLDYALKQQAQNGTNGSGGTGGAYTPGANPIVDGWVQNINSGKAKLSDLTGNPALKNLVSQGLASSGGSSNDILTTTVQSLDELNDMVNNNKGFSGAVGSKLALGTLGGIVPGGLPGTSEANFNAKLNQVKNDVILPNLTLLHGLGRITDREFQALSSAITSLSPNLSEDAFKSELKNITDTINSKVQSAQSTQNTNPSNNSNTPVTSGTTSSGVTWTITQ